MLDVYLAGHATGAPLLFLTGTPGAGIPFGPLVDVLEERGLRYVSFNRAGYGASSRRPGRSIADVVDDVIAVLDHLGAERCHVIGWSGGGPHAIACAALLAERVGGVATIGSVAPYPAEGLDFLAGMGRENVEEFGRLLAGPASHLASMERSWVDYRSITAEQVAAVFGDLIDDVDRASLTGDFAAWMAASFRECLREGFWGWYDDDEAFIRPWGFDLGAIEVPIHLWQGGHDRMVPSAHGEWLAAHIPGACRHLLPEHGHLTPVADSQAQILDELLRTG